MHVLDVSQAYLQADELKRTVYVRAPVEAGLRADECWKLLKPLYGLGDAAREWHDTLKAALVKLGFKPVESDAATFVVVECGEVIGFLAFHVDDGIFACWHVQVPPAPPEPTPGPGPEAPGHAVRPPVGHRIVE